MASLPARRVLSALVSILLICLGLGEIDRVDNALQKNWGALQAMHLLVPSGESCEPLPLTTARSLEQFPRFLAIALAWQGTPEQVETVWPPDGQTPAELNNVTHWAIAQAYFARGFEQEGRQMLRLIPNSWRWLYNTGFRHIVDKEWPEALLWLERAMDADDELSGSKADLYRLTCGMRRHFSDHEDALAACQAFLQVAKSDTRAYAETDQTYINAGNYRMARDILIEGLAYEPSNSRYYV